MSDEFELTLPSSKMASATNTKKASKISLEIITQLIAGPDSPLGTAYFITIPADLTASLYPQPLTTSKRLHVADRASSVAFLADMVSKDLLHNVLAVEFGPWTQKSEPWLRSKVKVNDEMRDSCIYVRLTLDEASNPGDTQFSLNLYRSVAGQAGPIESTKWGFHSLSSSLVETVKTWIEKAEAS